MTFFAKKVIMSQPLHNTLSPEQNPSHWSLRHLCRVTHGTSATFNQNIKCLINTEHKSLGSLLIERASYLGLPATCAVILKPFSYATHV